MRLLGVFVVFAGCHSGSMAMPDAKIGGDDAPSAGLGIFVAWESNPSLPGPVSQDLTVSDVTFQLKSFQLLGDAGDAIRSKYLLTWSSLTEPLEESFPDAPAGVYSKVTLDFGGSIVDYSYQIHGTWKDDFGGGGGRAPRPFKIEDHAPLTAVLDLSTTLVAAGSAEVAIRLGLADALKGIDFHKVNTDEGVLVLDEDNPDQLNPFRSRLQRAFQIDN